MEAARPEGENQRDRDSSMRALDQSSLRDQLFSPGYRVRNLWREPEIFVVAGMKLRCRGVFVDIRAWH